MNRRIVVTGGTGYIGSHVARAFIQNGDHVAVIDKVRRDHTLKNITEFYHGDFSDSDALSLIKSFLPDVIVHCAGTSLVGPSISDPAEYYDNNISKTIKLLNFIKEFERSPIILFSSSASVYGNPTQMPIDESARTSPISPYGNTKLITEMMLSDYYAAYDISSVCFRYFNAAGAMPTTHDLGQEPNATHIVARALEASINNKSFILNGNDFDTTDGTCVRDYVHVWDIAQAHVMAVDYIINNPGAEIFNLGTNTGISNREVVDYVNTHYGLSAVTVGKSRPGDPAELIADSSKAQRLLNWHPEFSTLSVIVDSAYAWYTSR